LTYRVDSIDVLSIDDFARKAPQIFKQTGAGRLVLITCGDFVGTVWRSNIVISAEPVS
jgi:sortase (surface protein transpeptidase)